MLLIALAIVVIAAGGYLSYLSNKKRLALFTRFAAANGWTLTQRNDAWAGRWEGTPFAGGDHRTARLVLEGPWQGRGMVAFDYSFQTHTTDSQGHRSTTTHRYAVCAVAMPTALPRLQVTRENILTRFGGAIGLGDIEFESEDFNRTFRVTCPDPKFASDVIHPRQMAMLLAAAPRMGSVAWRMEGSDLICWADGRQDPAKTLERLALLGAVLDGVPSFVWHDRGVQGSGPGTA